MFLIAAEDHELRHCCKGFIKSKFVNQEGNITQQIEIIVEARKSLKTSQFLIARSLNDMVDDVWVRVLNPTLEPTKVYKNARTVCLENIEKNSRKRQINPDNNTKHGVEFDFQKHVNTSSMIFSSEEIIKVRSLRTKFEVIFLRKLMIWDFATNFITK